MLLAFRLAPGVCFRRLLRGYGLREATLLARLPA